MRTEVPPAVYGLIGTMLAPQYSRKRFPDGGTRPVSAANESLVAANSPATGSERTVSRGQINRYWVRRGLVSQLVLLHDSARESWRNFKKVEDEIDSAYGGSDGFIIGWFLGAAIVLGSIPFDIALGFGKALKNMPEREQTRFDMWRHNKEHPHDKVRFGERQRILFPPEDQYSEYWYHPEDTHGDLFS